MQVIRRKPPAAPRKCGKKVYRSLGDELKTVSELPPEKLRDSFQKDWNELEEALVWVTNHTELRGAAARLRGCCRG